MRHRILSIVLFAVVLLCLSFIICAVGSNNAIGTASRGGSFNIDTPVAILTLIVLALTAGVLFWYALETRKLPLATERTREDMAKASEIEFHPWLVGSTLEIGRPGDLTPSIWLTVQNVGKPPAFNVSFVSEFNFGEKRYPSLSHLAGFIAPGDISHFRIISLSNTPKEPTGENISVTISYTTHLKGSGIMQQDFKKAFDRWVGGECNYTVTLPNGEKFSK